MSQTIGIGETFSIGRRVITEEMHDRRRDLSLEPKDHLENDTEAKILRAYTRPRGQEVISIEVTEDEVKVTGLARGFALVDIVDDISEPAGYDTDFYVVRKAQLKAAEEPSVNVEIRSPGLPPE